AAEVAKLHHGERAIVHPPQVSF
ncbi:MAG: hypothetical protein QOG59_3377, partial [Solirubrobacteraceae bacterium]|nr:hypothetical protein [Solirubrobacteraceae bacterium]